MEDSAFVNKSPLLFLFSAGMKHKIPVREGCSSQNKLFPQKRDSRACFASQSGKENLVQTAFFFFGFVF